MPMTTEETFLFEAAVVNAETVDADATITVPARLILALYQERPASPISDTAIGCLVLAGFVVGLTLAWLMCFLAHG